MKVPQPRKLKSGHWHIQLRLGGESYYITETTEKKCRDKAALLKAEYKTGQRIERAKGLTLSKAIDKYIKTRENILSPSTIDGYRRIQKNRFQSRMDKPISAVGWQQTINDEIKLGISSKTLRNSYRFIVSVMAENGIALPKVTLPPLQSKTREWLEPEQIKQLIKSVKGTTPALVVYLGLHSLRRSEIAGLTWDNIDMKHKRITVSGSVVQNEDHKFQAKETNKTNKSRRTIPIMIPDLYKLLKAVPEEKRVGAVVDCWPPQIGRRVNSACRAAGLPEVGTHGLRHSFASLAYHLGMSELETMELGGWANTQTMHGIYTHLAAADRAKAENKMAVFFK